VGGIIKQLAASLMQASTGCYNLFQQTCRELLLSSLQQACYQTCPKLVRNKQFLSCHNKFLIQSFPFAILLKCKTAKAAVLCLKTVPISNLLTCAIAIFL
jgi:hypothetical protein